MTSIINALVSEIVERFDGAKKLRRQSDFLDLLADKPVRINPVLFAMEGNVRSMPTPELVRQQLEEVTAKLRKALPQAQLVLSSDGLRGALGLIEESRQGFERKRRPGHVQRAARPELHLAEPRRGN